jgi:DNA (cytosine-5)-methyltransferase 1
MRFVSLFAGIGGMDLGLEWAGMECVAQVENDPWCTEVLAKHWPDVPRWSDIHDLDPDALPPHDLIAGGFPCQPVSLAGARKGQDDDRWLWPEYFRIVRHIRPRWVLVENVPGLASAGMGDVLGDLASVGYDTEWQSIPAAFVGAPHLRWRIFLVGYSHSDSRGLPIFPQRYSDPAQDPANGYPRGNNADGFRDNVADPDEQRRNGRSGVFGSGWRRQPEDGGQWTAEPDVGRVAYGVPRRVDRLRGLGNAVVPQVAQLVGEQIMANSRSTPASLGRP